MKINVQFKIYHERRALLKRTLNNIYRSILASKTILASKYFSFTLDKIFQILNS